MTFPIPCPNCRQTVTAPLGHGGRYVSCPACGASFLVIDESTLPSDEILEFRPFARETGTSGAGAFEAAAPEAAAAVSRRTPVAVHRLDSGVADDEADDSLKPLATVSVFLGGFSLALICIPQLAIVSSVAGVSLGVMSLRTTGRHRAILGTLLNTFALLAAGALFVERLRDWTGP